MKNTDFISPAARLEDALRQLEHSWQNTKEHWSDPVSQIVEDEYLAPLHSQVSLVLDAVNRISEVMGHAERACSHSRESGPAL